MNSLYNLKSLAPNTYAMAKFDAEDFTVAAIYNLAPAPKGQGFTCDCPANQRTVITKLCKHRRMLPLMLGAVNTDRFFDPETDTWCQPLGDLIRPGHEEGREAMLDEVAVEGVGMSFIQYDAETDSTRVISGKDLVSEALRDEATLISINEGAVVEAALVGEAVPSPIPVFSRAAVAADLAKPAPTIRRR